MSSAPRTPARGIPLAPALPTAPTVGGYTLLARIGEGGMGVVHLARRGPDGPRVALKVLRPHVVGDEETRRRLGREVASLQRIRSRWVAEIVDADPWAPVPYVATRYVPGLSLHDRVAEEGPITGRDLTWFAAGLAEGVASVHAVGVLHRDVKPSNVLMEGRTPILIDFGLARVADDPRLTHTGWLLGTPGYLAPEILYGDDATPASDVHSWAATVAYAATGRPPFGRGPSMAIMDRVRRGEHDLSAVPEPLRGLLAAALDPEPARRPGLDAILGWLRPQVAAAPVRPGPPPPVRPVESLTLPIAAASGLAAEQPTDRLADGARPPGRPWPTLVEPVGPTVVAGPWPDPVPTTGPVTPPPRAPWAERSRRAILLGVASLVCGAAVAAYPWLAAGTLIVLTWLLRSGSLAASAAGERRRVRGRRWYDGPLVLLRTPWDLVASVPATVLLVLWSVGLAVAAALVCYALAAGALVTLFVGGTAFAVAVWSGPGGHRVRSPLGRVVRPLSRRWKAWLAAVFALLVLAAAIGAVAESQGVRWTPGHQRPLSGHSVGRSLPAVAR